MQVCVLILSIILLRGPASWTFYFHFEQYHQAIFALWFFPCTSHSQIKALFADPFNPSKFLKLPLWPQLITHPIRKIALQFQPPAHGLHFSKPASKLRKQWTQPTDVCSTLILLSGEIVNKALAQLARGVLTRLTFPLLLHPDQLAQLFFITILLKWLSRLGPNNIPAKRKPNATSIQRPIFGDNLEKRQLSL